MATTTKGRQMSLAERVKFDAAMTQLTAAMERARLQPGWEKAKRERQIAEAMKVRRAA